MIDASMAPRPVALDLFCGAGGASLGLLAAGFQVHGVDLVLFRKDGSPRNPIISLGLEADVSTLTPGDLASYDFVWASPPCQAFSAARRLHGAGKAVRATVNLIPKVRRLINEAGVPGVIENVPGAPLRADLALSGPQVGEPGMLRKRKFEFLNMSPPAQPGEVCGRAADLVNDTVPARYAFFIGRHAAEVCMGVAA